MDQSAYFEQMRKKRKKEILEAAKEAFLQEGIQTFTMQKLAKGLDISTVTLYKYFRNSEEVMETLMEESFIKIQESFKVCEEGENSLEKLLFSLKHFFEKAEEERKALGLCFLFAIHLKKFQNIFQQESVQVQVYPILKKGQEEGCIRKDLSEEELWSFLSNTSNAVLQQIFLTSEEEYSKKEAKQWVHHLLASYGTYLEGESA